MLWDMNLKKLGIKYDNDILGIEYTHHTDQGAHSNHNYDLLLRLELKEKSLKKLAGLFQDRNVTVSEMVEELLSKVLQYTTDLEEIIRNKKPHRGNLIKANKHEHVLDLSKLEVRIEKVDD